jgi:hypothetical protein
MWTKMFFKEQLSFFFYFSQPCFGWSRTLLLENSTGLPEQEHFFRKRGLKTLSCLGHPDDAQPFTSIRTSVNLCHARLGFPPGKVCLAYKHHLPPAYKHQTPPSAFVPATHSISTLTVSVSTDGFSLIPWRNQGLQSVKCWDTRYNLTH